ncbi:MAG: 16S rRNA (uracil(1498)-N(3))-methyltransferase [Actinomycetota bacterium]|nr:16S rRNA (uracil(1498)-N(3))-methyltransferase [Actinomycetota bacterium]
MSAPHVFASSVASDVVQITGDDAHHAVRVLRLRTGERITVSDGAGNVANATITDAEPRLLRARVDQRRHVPRVPPWLVVVQGIPKAGKLDLVVQKLTEIGVDEIVPLKAARSVARWDDGEKKVSRLSAIAREAAKQSHRAWLPDVGLPVTVEGLPAADLTIVLHEEEPGRLVDVLPPDPPARFALVVGPEGGFAGDEIAMFVRNGAQLAGLGGQILRTETAALVAASLVLGRYGRIG